MSLVEFLTFTLSCAGFTVILVLSHILDPLRVYIESVSEALGKLINCTMCTGFWVGVCSSAFFDINPLVAGAISSVVSWSLATFVDSASTISMYLESVIEDGDNDEGYVE